jgi:Fe-S-cluster containining protein
MMDASLIEAIDAASKREDVVAAVHEVYGRVTAEIDRRRPVCVVSGRCCRFEEYGHRLYLTTMELATFLHDLGAARLPKQLPPAGCPFQAGKLCTIHAIRPFGCRMFFCDSTSAEWQNAAYERFHTVFKSLHEQLDVPYAYMEWRNALKLLIPSPSGKA